MGGLIAVGGLLAGAVIGVFLGTLLSLQSLVINTPRTMSVEAALNLVLNSARCQLSSLNEMHKLLEIRPENTSITIINVEDDPVIKVDAALNTKLGCPPGKTLCDKLVSVKENLYFFWSEKGGHDYDDPALVLVESSKMLS